MISITGLILSGLWGGVVGYNAKSTFELVACCAVGTAFITFACIYTGAP